MIYRPSMLDNFGKDIRDFNLRRIKRGEEVEVFINTDGAGAQSRGPVGAAYVIVLKTGVNPEEWDTVSRTFSLGEGRSHHEAEYEAAIAALKMAFDLAATKVVLRSDSKLMVDQMNGPAKVKNAALKPLNKKLRVRRDDFGEGCVEFRHVGRERNKTADRLSKDGLAKNK